MFSLNLNVPLGFASGNIEDLGESKLTVLTGPVIKCLLLVSPVKVTFDMEATVKLAVVKQETNTL